MSEACCKKQNIAAEKSHIFVNNHPSNNSHYNGYVARNDRKNGDPIKTSGTLNFRKIELDCLGRTVVIHGICFNHRNWRT